MHRPSKVAALEQLRGMDLQGVGEGEERAQGDIALALLDQHDEVAMEGRQPGQVLLTQPPLMPELPDPLSQNLPPWIAHRAACVAQPLSLHYTPVVCIYGWYAFWWSPSWRGDAMWEKIS